MTTHLDEWQAARDDFQHLGHMINEMIIRRDLFGGEDFLEDETFIMAWHIARLQCAERATAIPALRVCGVVFVGFREGIGGRADSHGILGGDFADSGKWVGPGKVSRQVRGKGGALRPRAPAAGQVAVRRSRG